MDKHVMTNFGKIPHPSHLIEEGSIGLHSDKISMVVIDSRSLERECFVRCVDMMYPAIKIEGYRTIEEWRNLHSGSKMQIIIYNIGNKYANSPDVLKGLKQAVLDASPSPVIVLGDSEDLSQIVSAFDCGAHGYMPSSIGLTALVEAAKHSSSGGIFFPMTSISALRDAFVTIPKRNEKIEMNLTSRQIAVSESLRKGKPNKTIAYELNMCESTVKVHIRNILKKLNAANRTEAAFKLNMIFTDNACC